MTSMNIDDNYKFLLKETYTSFIAYCSHGKVKLRCCPNCLCTRVLVCKYAHTGWFVQCMDCYHSSAQYETAIEATKAWNKEE